MKNSKKREEVIVGNIKYRIIKSHYETIDGKRVRIIDEVELISVSPTELKEKQ